MKAEGGEGEGGKEMMNPSTSVKFLSVAWKGEYVNDRRRLDTGVAAIGGDAGALPISRFLGEPSNDFQHYFDYRQTLKFLSVSSTCLPSGLR